MKGWHALLLLFSVLLVYFWPVCFGEHVYYPCDNHAVVGLAPQEGSPHRTILAYDDQISAYLPDLGEHLGDDHASWIATWDPHNEFGRPLLQYFGIGRSFLLGNLLACCTDDPFHAYSWLAVFALTGAALFCFLFLGRLGLHPLAACAAALGLSLGLFHAGWQTWLMLHWDFCWVFALWWGIERLYERRTAGRWLWIVFAIHALLLTGYPQHIVYCGWLSALWIGVRSCQRLEGGRARLRFLGGLVLAAVLAVVSVLPVYLDLLAQWSASARLGGYEAELRAALPRIESLRDLRVWLLQLYDVFWLGDPLSASYPHATSVSPSHSLTPLFASAALLGCFTRRLRLAWVWLLATVAVVPLLVPGVFAAAAPLLGLSLSQLNPLIAALLPLAVLSGFGLDAVLRGELRGRAGAVLLVALVPLALVATSLTDETAHLDWGFTAVGLALALGCVLLCWRRSQWVLALLLLVTVFQYGPRLQASRPRADVRLGSPLVRELGDRTPAGMRYAWVGRRSGLLLMSNQEALLGLHSVHTHSSFPTREFHAWKSRLGGAGARASASGYSRRFWRIESEARLTPEDLSGAALGLYVSLEPLSSAVAGASFQVGPVYLSTPVRSGPPHACFEDYALAPGGSATVTTEAFYAAGAEARRLPESRSDRLLYELEPAPGPRLFFLSQAFHASWRAFSAGEELECVRVNELFQGVLLPEGTARIELRFLPWVRWSLAPQVLFALATLACWWAGRRARARGVDASLPAA